MQRRSSQRKIQGSASALLQQEGCVGLAAGWPECSPAPGTMLLPCPARKELRPALRVHCTLLLPNSHAAHLRTLRVSISVIHTILAPSMQPSSFRACVQEKRVWRRHRRRHEQTSTHCMSALLRAHKSVGPRTSFCSTRALCVLLLLLTSPCREVPPPAPATSCTP